MSASVTAEDVKGIAILARLTMSDEEVATATRDLNRVLEHFSSLQSIDTKSVSSSADVTGQQNITREDKAEPGNLSTAEALLLRAPTTQGSLVKVPAVF